MMLIQNKQTKKFLTIDNTWDNLVNFNIKEGNKLAMFTRSDAQLNRLPPNQQWVELPQEVKK